MNDDLPTFVVLPDARGFAPNGPGNWTCGFLPAAHQGTLIRPGDENPIADLFPPRRGVRHARKRIGRPGAAGRDQPPAPRRARRRFAARRSHRVLRAGGATAVERAEVLDLSGETEAMRELYGLDDAVPKTSVATA